MTEPTDAELDELRQANSGKLNFVTFSEFRTIARAALAKWGTPAGAGEVVACGNCGGTGWMVRDPDIGTDQECFVCGGSGGYSESATPQPTQAQPVPASAAEFALRALVAAGHITQERVDQAMALPGAPAQAGAGPLTPFIPAQRKRLYYNRPENVGKDASLADWHRIVQFIEAAHGIKGCQHGADI